MSEQPSGPYHVMIEGTVYDWHKESISVPEIRQLGGLPEDRSVVEVDLQTNETRKLAEDDVHHPAELEPGKGVSKRVNFQRG